MTSTSVLLTSIILLPLATGFVAPSIPMTPRTMIGSASSSSAVSAFFAPSQSQWGRRTTSLCMYDDEDFEDDDEFEFDLNEPELEELDRAREMFEALLQKENPYSASAPTVINAFQDEKTSSSTDDFSSSSFTSNNRLAFSNSKRSNIEGNKVDDISNLLDRLLSKTERLINEAEQKLADCIDAEKLLTTEGRMYRENEMRMIQYITTNDAAEEAIRHYWTTEHEVSPIEQMALITSEAIAMDDQTKQRTLESMVETFPTWAEPHYVLGNMYHTRKHYELAEHYLTQAIQLKPWHFMAVSKLVATYYEMGNKNDALQWYERQLPRVSDPQRRTEWISMALKSAKQQLHNAECFTDDYYNKKNSQQQKLVEARIVQQHQQEKQAQAQQQQLSGHSVQPQQPHWTTIPFFTIGSSSVSTLSSVPVSSSVQTPASPSVVSSSSTSSSPKLPLFRPEQSFFEPSFLEDDEWQ